jgi:hypothetical protein
VIVKSILGPATIARGRACMLREVISVSTSSLLLSRWLVRCRDRVYGRRGEEAGARSEVRQMKKQKQYW